MNTSNRIAKLLIAPALIVFGAPQIVDAATTNNSSDRAAVHVSYADLDLSSEAGLTVLYRRLSNATRSICGEQIDARIAGSFKQLRTNKQCYKTVLIKSVGKLHNIKLEEIHKQRNS